MYMHTHFDLDINASQHSRSIYLWCLLCPVLVFHCQCSLPIIKLFTLSNHICLLLVMNICHRLLNVVVMGEACQCAIRYLSYELWKAKLTPPPPFMSSFTPSHPLFFCLACSLSLFGGFTHEPAYQDDNITFHYLSALLVFHCICASGCWVFDHLIHLNYC